MREVRKSEETPNANGLALVVNKNFSDFAEKKIQRHPDAIIHMKLNYRETSPHIIQDS